ncbi:cofilin [Aplysia californica]|uniref:Cofilin n=1 Tax=Aplysia californica TaxID=6500 RepID=A0ABM1W2P3_APLCA|nr:cofilin [Aplysia californica]
MGWGSGVKALLLFVQASGVSVADECLLAFDEVQMGHRWLYIIYRISDDLKTIIVEEKAGHSKGGVRTVHDATFKCCQYFFFSLTYIIFPLDLHRPSLTYIIFPLKTHRPSRSPDRATIKQKMLYTTSKKALRNKMRGIHAEIQCTDDTDLTMANILERICSKYT